jgi:hypothetical protein
MHYEFKSGESMEIRPLQSLKAKDRDAYEAVVRVFIKFDDEGKPDLSELPFSMSLAALQRNALISRLVKGWTFKDDDGQPLPVPTWNGSMDEVTDSGSVGEIGIDDFDELMEVLAPYITKVTRKPDPKETTTGDSRSTSKARESDSPTG